MNDLVAAKRVRRRRNPGSIPAGGVEFAFVFRDLLLHLLSFATNQI